MQQSTDDNNNKKKRAESPELRFATKNIYASAPLQAESDVSNTHTERDTATDRDRVRACFESMRFRVRVRESRKVRATAVSTGM